MHFVLPVFNLAEVWLVVTYLIGFPKSFIAALLRKLINNSFSMSW